MDGRHSTRPSPVDQETRIGWRMGALAMEVAGQVGAGAILGWLFDRWQSTAPTGLLVGASIGIVVGLWSLIRGALKLNRLLDQQCPTAGRGRPAAPPAKGSDETEGDLDEEPRPDER